MISTLMLSNLEDLSEDYSLGTSIPTITKNLIQRHIQEIKDSSDQVIPRVGIIQNLRTSFREFYLKEQVNVFTFLDGTVPEHVNNAQKILKRFGRADYNGSRAKIRDLCLDLSCNVVLDSIQSTNNLDVWVTQTRQFFDLWKETTTQLHGVEKRLDIQLKSFQDIQKSIQSLLQLPHNDAYESLITSTEAYLKHAFDNSILEELYTEYIICIKKLIVLTDAVSLIRVCTNSTDPQCSVCMNEIVSIVSIPCGHTFCQTCGQKQIISCYVCRQPVKDRQKIYFS